MHAMPLILGVLAALAIAYRFYSAFLAAKVAALDDQIETPAHRLNDGQNYHPTSKWVLFGHHFAAISGAGPLIGPVLAIQYGYMPGLIWLVVGVCLAGAVQDMLVLAASVRRNGRSLAEIARAELGGFVGTVVSVTILFVVVVALAGLGVVVVKALGGEEAKVSANTAISPPSGHAVETWKEGERTFARVPENSRIVYPNGSSLTRSEAFTLVFPKGPAADGATTETLVQRPEFHLPAGVVQVVPGSSWGTFTIACTIPIALFVGLYMYKIRKGKVVEASLIGAVGVLLATVIGNWIPGSALEPYFSLTRQGTIVAICLYGFIASVLPVWLLLCPRDYLSSFLKIGTVALLVGGVVLANPRMEAPMVNPHFAAGGGPYFDGPIFPFVFICIMCGAVSGFHALVSSGTTPKMIAKENHIRTIGYGAMLIEGLVGVLALIAAASLPQGDYWAINIDLAKVEKYAATLEKMNANQDRLPEIERQVGGESLRGRTGGAVTLAVGMAQIFTDATRKLFGAAASLESVVKYWYHFAIMFEALFILTTIDTGTRIARFLLQEALGKVYAPFDKPDWVPGAVLSTAIVTAGWGGLIWTGSVETIWPMFGIANQSLAVIALGVVTAVLINAGRSRYALLTVIPMLFVTSTTISAGCYLASGPFFALIVNGLKAGGSQSDLIRGSLNLLFTVFVMASVLIVLANTLARWLAVRRASASGVPAPGASTP